MSDIIIGDATLKFGNCLEVLKQLPDESVQCCVTSPPYWGLRDYGVDGQLGAEDTPQEFVTNIVNIFAEVHRVLKDDGTLWVNLGDSYMRTGGGYDKSGKERNGFNKTGKKCEPQKVPQGFKEKDLVGIPWRVAFALQDFGWYLRQDIIWAKQNPMPESVKDRCTKSHEYIFLLSKNKKYYYDNDAIKEPTTSKNSGYTFAGNKYNNSSDEHFRTKSGNIYVDTGVKNKRSVWTVNPKPYGGAHFAVYPPKLIEPCILAGSKEGDIVLDPFNGSGTTGEVALKHGRKYIGIDLNSDYLEIARNRLTSVDKHIIEQKEIHDALSNAFEF